MPDATMAKRYNQDELWALIRHAVGLDHSELFKAPMNIRVKDQPGQGPTVIGLIAAEPGEGIDDLAQSAAK